MEYRRLGRSGLKLSALSLGSWQITQGTPEQVALASAAVRRAYELGVNHFDSAVNYGRYPHDSEAALGAILREFPRHTYTVSSKMYWQIGPSPFERGCSRKTLFDQVHLSLKAMGLDYIDVFYCHRYDEETDLEETLRALDDLVAQGKILYYGFSEWNAAQIENACAIVDRRNLRRPVVHQPAYNLLQRWNEGEVMAVGAREGLGYVAYSPLATGILAGKYPPGSSFPAQGKGNLMRRLFPDPLVLEKVDRLRPIAAALGVTMSQMALAWVLRRPEVTSALMAASRPEQVDENLRALEVRLSDDVLKAIDGALA